MKRILLLILSIAFLLPLSAQKRNTTTRRTTTTTTTKKKTPAAKVDKKTQLKNEQAATQKARKESQAQLAQLNKSVKSSLDSVLILDNQIGKHQTSIDSLNQDIVSLDANIVTLNAELTKLQKDLAVKKKRYAKAVVSMRKTRSVQSKLMFIFSADNFSQMVRRMRYMQEYSTFQKAQGELLKEKQEEVKEKQNELLAAKAQKEANLHQVEEKKKSLQGMKTNCQSKVDFLNKNIATVQKQITEYQKKEASLNAEIDRIIKAEIEAARRAEAERKRKAEEARKKAEAEAREKARKLAEAKAAAERARKAEAEAAAARKAAKTEAEKTAAKAAEEKAKAATKAAEADVKVAAAAEKENRTKIEAWKSDTSSDAKLSSNFTSNKGRLPMPITGSYSVVGHYGNYTVSGLRNVTLDNKGIDIRGQQGCAARAVFDGQVSSVFQYGGAYIVMLRHGSYISVYSGLSSVSVRKGQNVKTRDTLGAVGQNSDGNYVLHFQLRNESARLNPEAWVR
ncbi:MAG: peptidoglycan DD-metalloendopeptidase family protein [Prevotellaceae bacterium]|nr:peptidoglycan DD-metalloendopeptidase family protein [Candidatus Minthosoma caballi]